MTTLQKTLVAAALVAAIGVGTYEALQVSRLETQVKTLQQQQAPRPEPSKEAALLSLQAKIALLETQHSQLTSALTQASADKARLETEREQARHSAALYKELAERAHSKDNDLTNDYPTERHIWVAWGRLGRLEAQLSGDQSKLSPEEKAANDAARLNAMEEIFKLVRATKQLQKDKPSGSDSQPEDQVDMVACTLYGALNLDEQQFSSIYGLIQKLDQENKQSGLADKEKNSGPEAVAAWQQTVEQLKAGIQPLLTPEQTGIFEKILTDFVHTGTNNWSLNINFSL